MKSSRHEGADLKVTVKYFTVPGDVFMDILYILLANDLQYEIKSVNRNENSILLYLEQEKQPAIATDAIENIESILSDYNAYLTGVPNNASL